MRMRMDAGMAESGGLASHVCAWMRPWKEKEKKLVEARE